MIILNFFIGSLIVAAGVLSLKYNYQVVNMFGRNNWFERKLGSGSSYPIFKLFSILAIFIGLLWAFSLHDNVLGTLVDPVINQF